MSDIITIVMLIANMLPVEDQRAAHAFSAEYVPELHEGMPAILTVYDPALGGVNCDGDCTTVATGLLTDEMYGVAGACPAEFLGATVYFDDIDVSMRCVDTGGMIGVAWSERDQEFVVYFDALWHLSKESGKITGAPYWNQWLLPNWRIAWGR